MDLLTRLLVLFQIILSMDFLTEGNCPKSCPNIDALSDTERSNSMINYIDLNLAENKKLRDLIVFGHNGLRNRLAERLNVCDMITMFWDTKLSDMARCQHINCTTHQQDMQFNQRLGKPTLLKFGNLTAKDLAWSMFMWPNFQMENFIQRAIFHWYRDHMWLKRPQKVYLVHRWYYELHFERTNRFAQIINPPTNALGCSLAKLSSGLSLLCYYMSLLPPVNATIYLRKRPSEYQCPFNYPIHDELFSHLCKYAEYRPEVVT
ncbi:uncharacterized protein LOC111518738 [Drosophila willistoni]|uniref:uncharacterized protein LOC111518738 n=1 Tax=Drosophila willistoni TaxID=7260 RepID=UPI001F085766|nr:uncharacterized protein LOC111518738 [Drosophila willistoni]XP_046865588.1 uncharacterized protein LOC111518738 [Drosophila willistoni]